MAESEPATIDALFRSAMSDWRTKEHASLGESIPVVVRREALLTLYWKGQAHAKTVTGQEYELLQRISHYPLASFLFAHQGAGRSQADVEALLSLVRAEVDGREELDLDGSVWSAVEKVQAICGDLLQRTLQSGSLRYEDVETFSSRKPWRASLNGSLRRRGCARISLCAAGGSPDTRTSRRRTSSTTWASPATPTGALRTR